MRSPRFLNCGDSAMTVEFGNRIDTELLDSVSALDHRLTEAQSRGEMPGLVETVPTFRSLTLIYNPLYTSRLEMEARVTALLKSPVACQQSVGRHWHLPVCYGGEYGPDLADVARKAEISEDEVVRLHQAVEFHVYMLGFLPGFPFMGKLPDLLSMPRRPEPRVRVPAGSVAITGELAAIYPWASPGGWQLLGRCPVPVFDPEQPRPVLFAPGDRVNFYSIDPVRFNEMLLESKEGGLSRDRFLVDDAS